MQPAGRSGEFSAKDFGFFAASSVATSFQFLTCAFVGAIIFSQFRSGYLTVTRWAIFGLMPRERAVRPSIYPLKNGTKSGP
jgi:hypothetical protein